MKLTPKTVFIILIAAAILIPILLYGWNELQKQPIDIVMYGAEIKSDGTVVQETEFRLTGYLKKYYDAPLLPYQIFLDSVTFSDTLELKQELFSTETFLMLSGNIHAPYYTAYMHTTNPVTTGIGTFDLKLCSQLCHCVIKTEGRYFVGSTRQNDTIEYILDQFQGLELE